LALLDRQLDDLAADLRANLDLDHWINAPVGHHQLGETAPRHLLGLHRDDDLPFPLIVVSARRSARDQARADQKPNPASLLTFAVRHGHSSLDTRRLHFVSSFPFDNTDGPKFCQAWRKKTTLRQGREARSEVGGQRDHGTTGPLTTRRVLYHYRAKFPQAAKI